MSVSLAAIAAIGSLAATGISAGMSAMSNADARARLAADREEDRKYYARLLSRDYVNSSENQSLLRRLQEMQRKNYERARATNVVAGGTDASLAAMQQAGNDIVTQTAQGIAARADAYKDRVAAAKRASEKAYSQQMFGLDQQKAQTIAQAGGQASKAFAGLASAAGTAENPFNEGTQEAGAAIAKSAEQPTTKATIPTFGQIDTSGITDPAVAEALKNTDLNKVVATVPNIMNGKKAIMTPEQYDALVDSIVNRDMFSVIR